MTDWNRSFFSYWWLSCWKGHGTNFGRCTIQVSSSLGPTYPSLGGHEPYCRRHWTTKGVGFLVPCEISGYFSMARTNELSSCFTICLRMSAIRKESRVTFHIIIEVVFGNWIWKLYDAFFLYCYLKTGRPVGYNLSYDMRHASSTRNLVRG